MTKTIRRITADVKKTQSDALRSILTGAHTGSLRWRKSMAEERHSGNPGNFAEDREKASRAGHVGGQHSSGNFANDRERAADAGRKGGQASHGGSQATGSESGGRGAEHNSGNFADDREKAAAAGRKGGHSSH
jgi:uncharacterized protein